MNDGDLRERLTKALTAHRIECTGPGEVTCRGCRDKGWMSWPAYYGHVADPLMPVVREALAQAWDEGYEGGEDDTFKELRGISTDRGHNERATNPWREDN